jgi:hypothetical protein
MAGKRGFVLSGKARAGASVLVSVSVLRGMRTILGEESQLRDALRDIVVNAEYICSLSRNVFQSCNEYHTPRATLPSKFDPREPRP